MNITSKYISMSLLLLFGSLNSALAAPEQYQKHPTELLRPEESLLAEWAPEKLVFNKNKCWVARLRATVVAGYNAGLSARGTFLMFATIVWIPLILVEELLRGLSVNTLDIYAFFCRNQYVIEMQKQITSLSSAGNDSINMNIITNLAVIANLLKKEEELLNTNDLKGKTIVSEMNVFFNRINEVKNICSHDKNEYELSYVLENLLFALKVMTLRLIEARRGNLPAPRDPGMVWLRAARLTQPYVAA